MKSVIVLDSDHPGAFQNKCFEPAYANQGSGNVLTVKLALEARRRGYDIITGDIFLARPRADVPVFCITDMHSARTEAILARGAVPAICYCTESPLIAKDFYINIKRFAGRFVYSLQFRGTYERLRHTPTKFETMYFPTDGRVQLPGVDWHDREFLVMINRNKRAYYANFSSLKDVVRSVLSPIKYAYQKMIDPWIRSKEIYKDRIEVIRHFADHDLALYGQGWEKRIPGFGEPYNVAARKAFRSGLPTDQKLPTMSKYKFCICFENCAFPGYVTEKIFDCFLAGTIPIYYGAPDIADFVPADTFVDFRRFKSLSDLNSYLQQMSPQEGMAMIDAAKNFLQSRDFDKYDMDNFVTGILDKVDGIRVGKS